MAVAKELLKQAQKYLKSSAKVQKAEKFLRELDPDEMTVLYHSGDITQDQRIFDEGLDPTMGAWVKEVAQGAIDDPDIYDEITSGVSPVFLSEAPNWVSMKVARLLGKPVHDVTTEDIRKHGQLTLASVMNDDPAIMRQMGEGAGQFKASDVEVFDLPFGVESNDIYSLDPVGVDMTLTGDDLVQFLARNYPDSNILKDPENLIKAATIDVGSAERARALGFGDTKLYHASGADIKEIKPSHYRGATFFSLTPEGAIKGAEAGAREGLGSGANAIYPVKLKTNIQGLTFTPAEKKVLDALPDTLTGEQVDRALKQLPRNKWHNYFDETLEGNPDLESSYKYTKKKPQTLEQAAATKKDVYGEKIPAWGSASDEKTRAELAKQNQMSGFLQLDEGGLTVGVVDPAAARSIFAEFDPSKAESGNLLANYAPIGLAGALGTGVALQSEDAAADNLTPAQQNALSAAENRLYQDFTPAQRKVLTRAQKRRNAHGASARRRREREQESAQLARQIERGEISARQLSPEQIDAIQRQRAAQIPELSGISDKITPLQAATILTTFDPLEAAQLFKQADPALTEVITPEGEVMLYNRNTGAMASINKPGPSKMDAMQGAFTASLFALAARPAKLTQQALAGMGTAAAIEATQAAQGGEFNPMDVALEGLLPAVGPALKGGLRRVKQWARGAK